MNEKRSQNLFNRNVNTIFNQVLKGIGISVFLLILLFALTKINMEVEAAYEEICPKCDAIGRLIEAKEGQLGIFQDQKAEYEEKVNQLERELEAAREYIEYLEELYSSECTSDPYSDRCKEIKIRLDDAEKDFKDLGNDYEKTSRQLKQLVDQIIPRQEREIEKWMESLQECQEKETCGGECLLPGMICCGEQICPNKFMCCGDRTVGECYDPCNPCIACVDSQIVSIPGTCDDGNPCTKNDHCVGGRCIGDPVTSIEDPRCP